MIEKIEESLYSKMQPTWMRSECGRLDAMLDNVDAMKECARRSKGKPFKVVLYFRGSFCHEFYCDSIKQGHDAMRRYVEKEL
jgi:hypothetical protein